MFASLTHPTLPGVALVDDSQNCWEVSGNHTCKLVYRFSDHNGTLAETTDWLVAKPLAIVALLIVGWLLKILLHRLIDRLTRRIAEGTAPGVLQRGKAGQLLAESGAIARERRAQRARSMGGLLKNIVTIVLGVVIGFMVIAQLGYDIGPLLASAGILGVAFGFGAQSLVKDFLSGIFMILEDQYGVGDVIDAGEASGTVENVGLRVTRLRDIDGTVWYVRNGEILRIGNMSQNWARTVLDIPVGYGEDLTRVREVLHDVALALWHDPQWNGIILEEPEVWGVQRWDADAVVVRVVLKTAPLEQWGVAREMRELIKDRFDAVGIEIPFPQRVVTVRHGPADDNADGDGDGESGGTTPRPDDDPAAQRG